MCMPHAASQGRAEGLTWLKGKRNLLVSVETVVVQLHDRRGLLLLVIRGADGGRWFLLLGVRRRGWPRG